MICRKCGYTVAYDQRPDGDACVACGEKITLSAEDWLSVQSLGLAREIRPGQIRIANTIEEGLRDIENRVIIAQGGCGIGKSFAYLVPALLAGKRVVVSTAKKSLQGQLVTKDLPFLQKVMHTPQDFVSVKGRANYACKLLLEKNSKQFKDRELHTDLMRFIREDPYGDLDQFPGGAQYPTNLCTASECVGRSCRYAPDCGFRKAKGQSRMAQVVVVNHSLLGFDLRFGPRKLMGEYDILIVDEVHAAEDSFRTAFSSEIRDSWPVKLFRDIAHNNINVSMTQPELENHWRAMFASVPNTDKALPPKFLGTAGETAGKVLGTLARQIREHVNARWGPGLATKMGDATLDTALEEIGDDDDRTDASITVATFKKVAEMLDIVRRTEDEDDNYIRVREENNGRITLSMKPIDVGRLVGPKLKDIPKVILTSATLQERAIQRELGVTAYKVISEPSPFNYKRNGLVYIPKHLPHPGKVGKGKDIEPETYHTALAVEIVKLIRASNGNGMVLFTSLKEMEAVRLNIERDYELTQPIFTQTRDRRSDEVLAEYMRTDNSVLFGSKSFFEGVDIQGAKLRLVVLTKLPFPMFGDPIVQAKQVQLGDEYFHKFYLPKMYNDLQQAGGRLIRTQTDRGVFAILDPRVWVAGNTTVDPMKSQAAAGYGGAALRQLPFTNRTSDFSLVNRFLQQIQL